MRAGSRQVRADSVRQALRASASGAGWPASSPCFREHREHQQERTLWLWLAGFTFRLAFGFRLSADFRLDLLRFRLDSGFRLSLMILVGFGLISACFRLDLLWLGLDSA